MFNDPMSNNQVNENMHNDLNNNQNNTTIHSNNINRNERINNMVDSSNEQVSESLSEKPSIGEENSQKELIIPHPSTEIPTEAPIGTSKQGASAKGSFFPIILFILAIAGIGYFTYNKISPENENYSSNNNTNIVESEKSDNKETTAEEQIETNSSESGKENKETPIQTESSTENYSSEDIKFDPGTRLYLYADKGIEKDGVKFDYVSNTRSTITLNVTINKNMRQYTITNKQETTIKGIKNPIVFVLGEEFITIEFK